MAMNQIDDAFEQQAQFARGVLTFVELNPDPQSLSENVRTNIQGLAGSVFYGSTYYLDSDIAQVIYTASQQLPLETVFALDMLPDQAGFVWSPSSLPIKPNGNESNGQPFRGFSWSTRYYKGSGRYATAFQVLYVMDRNRPAMACEIEMMAGRTLDQWLSSTPRLTEADLDQLRFMVVFGLFCQQEIITTRPERVSRAAQRRHRKSPIEPIVGVIQLRAHRSRTVARSGDVRAITDYQCRWLVRGHWRNQWYPSLDRHQPKWITPYVKGPNEKPLKQPSPHVFAVVR